MKQPTNERILVLELLWRQSIVCQHQVVQRHNAAMTQIEATQELLQNLMIRAERQREAIDDLKENFMSDDDDDDDETSSLVSDYEDEEEENNSQVDVQAEILRLEREVAALKKEIEERTASTPKKRKRSN